MVDQGLKLFGDFAASLLDVAQALLDLVPGEITRGRHVEEVVFLDVELLELLAQILLEQVGGTGAVGEGLAHGGTERVDECGGEAQGLVMLFDGRFDQIDVAVRSVADMGLNPTAEEVAVLTAMATGRTLDDHAADLARFIEALTAEQRSFEHVVIATAAFSRIAASLQQVLNTVEQFLVDEGSVPTRIGLASVLDEAEVVRVSEHGGDL